MSEAYTSAQYKYLLLKRLQRDLSMPDPAQRAYTYNFFVVLFEGISISGEAYRAFCEAMDDAMIWASENGVRKPADTTTWHGKRLKGILPPLFANVGIKAEMVLSGEFYGRYTRCDFNFEKPDGTKMTWLVYGTSEDAIVNDVRLNYRSGTELDYASASAPVRYLSTLDLSEADKLDPHCAGRGCYWRYDSSTNSLRIEGNGEFAGVVSDEQLYCGQYETLIIGPEVKRMLSGCTVGCTNQTFSCTKVAVLVPAGQPLEVDDNQFELMGQFRDEYKRVIDIYTDNENLTKTYISEAVKPYIVFHPLSEWDGT